MFAFFFLMYKTIILNLKSTFSLFEERVFKNSQREIYPKKKLTSIYILFYLFC